MVHTFLNYGPPLILTLSRSVFRNFKTFGEWGKIFPVESRLFDKGVLDSILTLEKLVKYFFTGDETMVQGKDLRYPPRSRNRKIELSVFWE